MGAANRQYKNSVFKDLFHDEAAALNLYNALTGSRFTMHDGLHFTTLDNALFMDRLNDISFTIADKLVVLIEHQSNINENMPLRALIYCARIYEKIIDPRAIYRTKLFTIPTPEFYVLYNGTTDFPDEATLSLSDAFSSVAIPGASTLPSLELTVRVLNVNKGHNEKILEQCEVLQGYAVFIGQIREYQREGRPLEEAIAAAITYCVANGILVEYLKTNGSEVHNMLFTEFNLEDAKQVWFEEGIEKGRKEGIEKGRKEGMDKGRKEGIDKGKLETARAMFAEGDSLEKIVRVTKLPLELLKEQLHVQ